MSKRESFFWTSYSDLMTSLFFVMLVLFVLAIAVLRNSMAKTEMELANAKRLLQIDKQFQPLVQSGSFVYYEATRKFVAKDFLGVEIFLPNKTDIRPEYINKVVAIGQEIETLLKNLSEENPDFSYLMILEGNMANTYDHRISPDNNNGYKTSYERALAVYQLWQRKGINLRKYNTEVQICGSGFNGIDRDKVEDNNKRFTIQILPKIKSPKIADEKE